MPEIHLMEMKDNCTFVTKHDLILKLEQFSINFNVACVVFFKNNSAKSVKTLFPVLTFPILTGSRIWTHQNHNLLLKKRGKSYVTEHFIGQNSIHSYEQD